MKTVTQDDTREVVACYLYIAWIKKKLPVFTFLKNFGLYEMLTRGSLGSKLLYMTKE